MFEIGKITDTGIKRRDQPNQDAIGVWVPGMLNRRPPLLVVADGMGGYSGGALASKLVVETILENYQHSDIRRLSYIQILEDSIQNAHLAIIQSAQKDPQLSKMGSTVVAAILEPNVTHFSNIGDSRAYLINEKQVLQISYDHSLVAEMVRIGSLTPEEAQQHPRRNVLTLSLSAQRQEVKPYTASIAIHKGDVILLCTDGLWGVVPETKIQEAVLTLPPQVAAERLVELANENEAPDNISVIIARKTKS